MGAVGQIGVLLFLLWLLHECLIVYSHPTIQCAHTGSGYLAYDNKRGWKRRQGPFTIGAKKFDSVYGGAMYSGFYDHWFASPSFFFGADGVEKQHCPYTHKPFYGENITKYGTSKGEIALCDEKDERVILRVNQVQQTDKSGTKHTLAGWLHLEVELRDKSDQIRMIYAQMYDEYYNAVGEFVMDPTEQCQASKPDLYLTPTPYQYLPCSAIGAREAKVQKQKW
ncbi:unnamed protein product [Orchesella dallaii]|uniref:Uncharacterized protein n=1 Tax=Orchesella dallaii TaxID=48710 RepID=A0ABP1RYR1_9HEXA